MKPHNAKMFKVTAANYADEVQLFSCFLWIFSSQKRAVKHREISLVQLIPLVDTLLKLDQDES